MIIAKVGGTDYLFYGAGDMGAGQFGNATRPNHAQALNYYEGKILRFNLEDDGDGGFNGFIPNSNPFNGTPGIVQSAVYANGIRNNQGFVFDTTFKILYGSSHGPYSDDEINIIESGRNYGHPLVIGYAADDNVNNTTAGAAPGMTPPHPSSCPMIVDESNNAASLGAAYKDPLFSAYPSSPAFPSITNLWNTTTGANAQWPSEAWSGLDLYTGSLIPGWKKSLIASSLKWGRLVKIRLQPNGTSVLTENGQDTISYFGSQNRFRDVAVAPNGKDLYVIMDRSTTTSGPSSGNPIVPSCQGCVQKYTFLGYNDNGGGGGNNSSSIPNTLKIATGLNNQCENASKVVINAANNNLNIWVPITDTNSNLIAEIYSTVALDTVTTSIYHKTGTIREDGLHHTYADRNITITPQIQPGTPVKVRFYLTTADFNRLDTAKNSLGAGSGIGGAITNVGVFKNANNTCASTMPNGGVTAVTVNATGKVAFGSQGYVLQANSVSSFSTFYFANASLTTLPIQLLTFTGNLVDDATLLNWTTSSEVNSSRFVVERSEDGTDFTAIGTVAAAGNSTSPLDYSFTDNNIATLSASTIYYRLRIEDINGQFVYSKLVSVSLAYITGAAKVFPNPAADKINVTLGAVSDGQVIWKLSDNAGRTVLQNTAQAKQGRNNFVINTSKLSSGIYYLKVSGAGVDQIIKIQKL